MIKKKKGVVYTCLIGNYDHLVDHEYRDAEWDYVCFTDHLDIADEGNASWQLQPLIFTDLDDVRNQRWHKIHPHVLFSDYEYSLYVDTNINILHDGIFQDIKSVGNGEMALGPHFARYNIFDEMDACVQCGKDTVEIIEKQRVLIKETGFSGSYGTFFDNSIIFRKHNSQQIIDIMEDWWWWVKNYSRRDQLSLVYVLWRHQYHAKSLHQKSYRLNGRAAFGNGEMHITKEELLLQKHAFVDRINHQQQEISKMVEEINVKNKQIENQQKQIAHQEAVMEKMKKEITLMQKTKVRKLQDAYLKLKQIIGF